MPHRLCILKDKAIVPVGEVEFSQWFWDLGNRQIAHTGLDGGRFVSTVFLGWEHGDKPGAWFETLIAGIPSLRSDCNQYMQHSATYADALVVHAAMVERAQAHLNRKRTPRA